MEVGAPPAGRPPADLAHLARADLRAPVDPHRIRLRDPVVGPRLRRPARRHVGVEAPGRHVHAHRDVRRDLLQRVRPEPEAPRPLPEVLLDPTALHPQGDQRLGPQRVAAGLPVEHPGGAAEGARPRHRRAVEGHPGLAHVTGEDAHLDAQPPGGVRGRGEGPLLDVGLLHLHLGHAPAVLAPEGLVPRAPAHRRAADVAGEVHGLLLVGGELAVQALGQRASGLDRHLAGTAG